jgi:cytochrome c5
MSEAQDRAFFSNFTIVVLILAVMMVIFIVAARWIGGMIDYGDPESKQERLAERLAPVGQVRLEGEAEVTAPAPAAVVAQAASATAAGDAGKAVYGGLCFNCHGTGIPGVPQLGDKAAWEARIAQGMEKLYANAINGFTGEGGMMMPPKGGNTALSDDEVKAAVDYMINAVQPVAAAEAAPAPAVGAVPAAEAAPAAEPAAGAATAGAGKSVYDGLCFNCHGTGIPGVPQLGDKAAWEARIAQGMEKLYANAINGFTGAGGMPMPPKGGNAALSDDEVKAAVDYIVSQSQ